jgi:large subunit ribosomal protein L17
MTHKHGITKYTLSRPKAHREALLKNLATSLIVKESITTTDTKAKAVKRYAEKIISIGKRDTLSSKRKVVASVNTEEAYVKIVNDLSKRYKNRNGGYIKSKKVGYRLGDNAPLTTLDLIKDTKPAQQTISSTDNDSSNVKKNVKAVRKGSKK